jgi:[ribosomal protein S5]-alanine N-acetyltransferase
MQQMTKAANLFTTLLICNFGFQNFEIVLFHADIFEFNPASMRVLEKCGFKREAVREKAVFKQGKVWNEMVYVKLIER